MVELELQNIATWEDLMQQGTLIEDVNTKHRIIH